MNPVYVLERNLQERLVACVVRQQSRWKIPLRLVRLL